MVAIGATAAGSAEPAGESAGDWPFRPWLRLDRGGQPESWLSGALAVVDDRGDVRARWGDPSVATFLRSSLKMVQAIPLVANGAADTFGLKPAHIALACASHDGEPFHLEAARYILAAAGVPESALHCGPHAPLSRKSADDLVRAGGTPQPIHNNCSGKHAGMLAACAQMDWPLDGYWNADHPLQEQIRSALANLAEVDADSMPFGVDGCGVPTYHLSLEAFARAIARFVVGAGLPAHEADATPRIVAAMNEHPEMVGGTERFCTAAPRAANRPVMAKGGAEGYYVLAWREGERGVALAAKAAAGDSRGTNFAVAEAMRQLGLLADDGLDTLARWHLDPIRNHAGDVIGERVPLLRL